MAIYNYAGPPPDTFGVQGDTVIDYVGRFLWGPKGSSSWAGTAQSIVGPTGPAGAQTIIMGPGFGPAGQLAPAVTLTTGTPTVFNDLFNTSSPAVFVAGAGNFFLAASFVVTTGSAAFELYDLTAGKSIYTSAVIAQGSSTAVGQFGNYTYPLVAGNTHVWRANGSGSFVGNVAPEYYMQLPVPAPIGVVSKFPPFQHIGAINSSTASNMGGVGDVALAYYRNARVANLYTVTITSAAGGSGAAIFYLYNLSTSATTYTVVDISGATVNLLPGQTLKTQVLNITLTATQLYQWRVYGSGSGTYTVTMELAL